MNEACRNYDAWLYVIAIVAFISGWIVGVIATRGDRQKNQYNAGYVAGHKAGYRLGHKDGRENV